MKNANRFILMLLPLPLFFGCSGKYDTCLEKQKEEYRTSNPNASYAQVQKKQAEFEMMCSSLKEK